MTNAAPADGLPYRPNAGAVLFNRHGLVFIGLRAGIKPGITAAWQFPQGGIDEGESPRDAVMRELAEEIGTANAEVLAEHPDWLTYDMPLELRAQAFQGRFKGQRQRWFALRFLGEESEIDLQAHGHPEFSAWRWMELAAVPALAVPFKRPIYEAIAQDFARFAVPDSAPPSPRSSL